MFDVSVKLLKLWIIVLTTVSISIIRVGGFRGWAVGGFFILF